MTHLVPALRPVLGTPFRRGDLYRRAGEVPSFHIAPARTGHAQDLITGNLLGTYNSASPAWAVRPDGVLALPAANAPVIEYDPTTLSCLGARICGVTANLSLQSNSIGISPWGTNNAGSVTYTSNAALSPAGVVNARRITATADFAGPNQFAAVTSGTTYTVSFFLKAVTSGSLDELRLELFGYFLRFKISTQAFSQVNANFTAYDAINYGNGWYRLYASAAAPSTGSLAYSLYAYQSADVYAWGAQFQAGPLAPYVPTTTLAASSTADVWDILSLTAGINNLKTLYFRGRTSASGTRGIASLNDNTANNRLELSTSGTDPKATAVTSGSTVADLNGGTIAANTTFRLAVRLDTDSYALSINGGAVVTDTSGARALVDRLFIGRDQAGNYMNGYIEEMAGWTRACTDAQVAALAAS